MTRIVPLAEAHRAEAARILREALAHMEGGYSEPGAADEEVATFLPVGDERFALAAVDGAGALLGWVGAITGTYELAWELHPLVVDPAHQKRGVGSALTAALEAKAEEAGVLTMFLGTDDDFGGTNLFGEDLYDGLAVRLEGLRVTQAGHPVAFYRRQGYAVVGVLPDVNGAGKPDILMAKRIGRRQAG